MKQAKQIIHDMISKEKRWHETSIQYTGRVRCPNCIGPLTQTKNVVPGNTKVVACNNCNKTYQIPREQWKNYTNEGLI